MKTSEKILKFLEENSQTATGTLVDYLEITDRAVRKQLKSLLDSGQIMKAGKPPRVYYSLAPQVVENNVDEKIDQRIYKLIEKEFYYISPRGSVHEGYEGFVYWCDERKMNVQKTAERYAEIIKKYHAYRRNGLIDGTYKIVASFDEVALDKVFYVDFYSMEIFGKTKLGQLLLFAKQSQNRKLINEIADIIKPALLRVIEKYHIDGVAFIPPTVKRLNLDVRIVSVNKIQTPITVPQKTLTKIEDRIINARETMSLDDTGNYQNILLIDDALGSGATLNEVAKKIRQKGICKGKIIGFVITGSFKGFEVISEV
jgi:DNA-binding Lrp family transcriptional regulator